jgi:hypothetical protein
MKKIFVFLFISLLGTGAFAQNDKKMDKMKSEKTMKGKDCCNDERWQNDDDERWQNNGNG